MLKEHIVYEIHKYLSDEQIIKFIFVANLSSPNIKKKTYHGGISDVTHLYFKNNFNESIKNIIPHTVTHLYFGNAFNKFIKNYIPDTVTHLVFGNKFNKPIDGCIPHSIIFLRFGGNFNHPLRYPLPQTLKQLVFDGLYYHRISHYHIPNLKYLSINTLEELSVSKSLSHLRIGFLTNVSFLKNTLVTHLKFCNFFNDVIDGVIPFSVTHLEFGNDFDQSIACLKNHNVSHLTLGMFFSREPSEFPLSLTHLIVHIRYCHNVPEFIKHVEVKIY